MKKPKYSVINGVYIGEQTKINDQVNLYRCKIGKNCKIDAYVYIEEGVEIGDNVKIRAFTFIPQGVKIESNVYIGPRVTFTNDKYPKVKGEWRLLKTIVREGASIGAGALILPGLEIGKYSLVGAGSVVTKDVDDYAIVVGVPAKTIGYVTYAKFKSKVRSFLAEGLNEIRGEKAEWPWP